MVIYKCPLCGQSSIMWDARADAFICHNPDCATAFGPPSLQDVKREDVTNALSLNRLNVTRQWIEDTVQPPARQLAGA
jgi:hypothetical protein